MKITNFDNAQTLTVEHNGVSYDAKIPAFCDTEEAVENYIKAFVIGKQSEVPVENEATLDLSTMVNKEI